MTSTHFTRCPYKTQINRILQKVKRQETTSVRIKKISNNLHPIVSEGDNINLTDKEGSENSQKTTIIHVYTNIIRKDYRTGKIVIFYEKKVTS